MKVISIGMGQKIFEENSAVRQRQIEYGKFFDELHLVVFTLDDKKFQNQKLSDNVFLYPSRSKIRIFYIFDFIRVIKNILKKSKENSFIISAQDPFETGIVGAFIKLFFNLPLHIQIHTDLTHKYFRAESLLNKIRFIMAEFVLKYANRVRVVSERIKNSISSFSKNIDVLPIKTEFKDLKIERLKDWESQKNILTVCRLEKEKNLETAICAFKKVLDAQPEATFTIVGDGNERENLTKLTRKLGISERVIFVGWQDDVEKYYKEAQIFISTSLYEGYGMSVIEAALNGLSLVLSDTGLVGDLFQDGDSALVCDAKDVDGFSKNILKIYNDKTLALSLAEKAKLIAEEHLKTLDNYFAKYADSVIKTASNFKKTNLIVRIFDFKKTAFNSFIALRYFICGITAATVNILSLYIFTDKFNIWYLYSSILAFFLSLVVSFTLQKFVVFKDNVIKEMHYQFSKFSVVAILGVITNTILVFIFTDILGFWYIFSQIMAGFFVMIQNFVLYRFFIFKKS